MLAPCSAAHHLLRWRLRGQTAILNVYVDDTSNKKTLIVGNVDDVSGLPFMNSSSERIYEENGQLYAVCESLLKGDAQGWSLNFPANGYYDEYHAVFLHSRQL